MEKLNTIRILLSAGVKLDWSLHQLDVKIILNGEFEEVCKDAPPRFEDQFGGRTCKFKKISIWTKIVATSMV